MRADLEASPGDVVGGEAHSLGQQVGIVARVQGDGVVVVEHSLDVIANADWIVDLGPEAAEEGGRIVAAGPPSAVASDARSHTGRYLQRYLDAAHDRRLAGAGAP